VKEPGPIRQLWRSKGEKLSREDLGGGGPLQRGESPGAYGRGKSLEQDTKPEYWDKKVGRGG